MFADADSMDEKNKPNLPETVPRNLIKIKYKYKFS
jgi:hypothetical protein